MHREYRALSVLWQAFPVAPRAYHYCADESVIGAPFFVMERRHGIVVRGAIPEVYGGGADETANRKISQTVVDTLADFHRVDPKPIGLDALGRKPESFLERQVKGWADRYERSKVDASPIAEEVVAWLLDAMPRSPTPTLVHNDWKLDNMALDPADPGRCVAVYDWDMCSVGDPLCDVGTLLALWSDPGETTSAATPLPVDRPGFLGRQQVVERYAERSGLPASGIPYYDVFGTFKMGVVLQQIYFRYHQGQTKDARFAGLGAGAQSLYRLAGSRRP
jgi:aminoglycoside phosphotransferase (APT) family kinase protein